MVNSQFHFKLKPISSNTDFETRNLLFYTDFFHTRPLNRFIMTTHVNFTELLSIYDLASTSTLDFKVAFKWLNHGYILNGHISLQFKWQLKGLHFPSLESAVYFLTIISLDKLCLYNCSSRLILPLLLTFYNIG